MKRHRTKSVSVASNRTLSAGGLDKINDARSSAPNSYDPFYAIEQKRFRALKKWRESLSEEELAEVKKRTSERSAYANRLRSMKVSLPRVRCLECDDE